MPACNPHCERRPLGQYSLYLLSVQSLRFQDIPSDLFRNTILPAERHRHSVKCNDGSILNNMNRYDSKYHQPQHMPAVVAVLQVGCGVKERQTEWEAQDTGGFGSRRMMI